MVHFDDNEIIDPAIREVKLFVDLAEQIDHAIKSVDKSLSLPY